MAKKRGTDVSEERGGVDTPMHTMYLNFVIGAGMEYMKWLKNRAAKGFIFHVIIPAPYLLL